MHSVQNWRQRPRHRPEWPERRRWLDNPCVGETAVEATELSVRKCNDYPGTYCGQAAYCPYYVVSKSCVESSFEDVRVDGRKARPHFPELQNLEINLHIATANEGLFIATTTVLAL